MSSSRSIMEKCCNKKCSIPTIVGDKLPGYSCKKVLGKGTFGTTFLMQKGRTDKVALKVIENDKSSDFKNEDKILKLLSSNCSKKRVLCHNKTFQEGGDSYFVTEFIKGSSLDDYKFKSKISLYRIFNQIIESIEYIHSLDIVHFDIKPQNIMIDSKHKVKLIDFGGASLMRGNKFIRNVYSPYYAPREYDNFRHFTKKQAQFHDWYSFVITVIGIILDNPDKTDTQLKELSKIRDVDLFVDILKDLIKAKGDKI